MRHPRTGASAIMRAALLIALVTGRNAGAQDAPDAQAATTRYTRMAPLEAYLMPDRAQEVALARSAAPEAISRDATVLVLGRQGYETAVAGTNGFVCMVDRGWTGPFDWPEYWNPRIRAAACLNPQAARSILPIARLRTRMVLAGRTHAEIVSALRKAFASRRLPRLESGAMAYMMSPSAYLTDEGGHNLPHVMFYLPLMDGADWGANVAGSPVMSSAYWRYSASARDGERGLPPMIVFLVALSNWSDGTTIGMESARGDSTHASKR
jgi:hypothetical protein